VQVHFPFLSHFFSFSFLNIIIYSKWSRNSVVSLMSKFNYRLHKSSQFEYILSLLCLLRTLTIPFSITHIIIIIIITIIYQFMPTFQIGLFLGNFLIKIVYVFIVWKFVPYVWPIPSSWIQSYKWYFVMYTNYSIPRYEIFSFLLLSALYQIQIFSSEMFYKQTSNRVHPLLREKASRNYSFTESQINHCILR
jgi:hypothetical protein